MIEVKTSASAFKAPASSHRPRAIPKRSSFELCFPSLAMERKNAEELGSPELAYPHHRLDREPEADGSDVFLLMVRRSASSRDLQPKRHCRQMSESERHTLRESFLPLENSSLCDRPRDASTMDSGLMEPLPSPHDAVCGIRMRPRSFFPIQHPLTPSSTSYVATTPGTSMEISVPVVEASPTMTPCLAPSSLPSSPPMLKQKEEVFEDISAEAMPKEVLLPLF